MDTEEREIVHFLPATLEALEEGRVTVQMPQAVKEMLVELVILEVLIITVAVAVLVQ